MLIALLSLGLRIFYSVGKLWKFKKYAKLLTGHILNIFLSHLQFCQMLPNCIEIIVSNFSKTL